MRERYPDYWDVTLGWKPDPGELGCYAEAGCQIPVTECPTPERAIELCREWRKVGDRVLHAINVHRCDGGEKP